MTCSRLNQKEEFEPCKKFEPKDDKFTDIFCQNMIDELNEYPTLEPQNHDIRQCYEAIQSRNARIAELEAQQSWVSVSDRLPENNTLVIVTSAKFKSVTSAMYSKTRNSWYEIDGMELNNSYVTHWMPLPDPPDTLK